ncbi:hypothetical protein [Streptomyces sp. NPDC006134]|uniref:hypothetical protein n=1 Tax=Streptomyces sp. NPDC006134 TaxID=3154467 RepID=UPI0033C28004
MVALAARGRWPGPWRPVFIGAVRACPFSHPLLDRAEGAPDGRLRRGWTARCLSVDLPATGLPTLASFLLPGGDTEPSPQQWVGLPAFLGSPAALVVRAPLQAAAEEYVLRGRLSQAVGGFLRSPWCAVPPQAALFATAHGWGTP